VNEAIKISNLTKIYYKNGKEVKVVNDLNLSIPKGKVFGFLGPNGAGKTTTIKMINSLIKPDTGEIKIFGQSSSEMEVKKKIGFMPENPYFYHYLTANEFLKFTCNIFEIAKSKQEKLIKEILKRVGLQESASVQLRNFSKGMGQRIGVAQALTNNPEVIFLDEPLDGLDPIGRIELKKIILEEKKKGKTIFFNSHILSDVEEISDYIGIIDQGKLIKTGLTNEIVPKNTTLEKYFVELIEKERQKK
jgi:ABC-2 type transport system ATP-binding protein